MDLQVNATAEVKYVPEVEVAASNVNANDHANIVDFDSPEDLEDPLNWSNFHK